MLLFLTEFQFLFAMKITVESYNEVVCMPSFYLCVYVLC